MKLRVANHIIPISAGVFLILNMFENIIHFSIGRNIKDKNNSYIGDIEFPEYYDIIKIVVIMIVFAFLQAFFTYYFVLKGY